jgi:hypothetical protein
MAKAIIVNSGPVLSFPGTIYIPIATGDTGSSSTEADRQITCRVAGTFSKLYIRITTNSLTGSSTFKSRKNGANGNQSISIGAGVTGEFYDDANTDSVVDGDTFSGQFVVGAGTSIIRSVVGATFDATTNTTAFLFNNSFQSPFSGTQFTPLIGPGQSATEADAQCRIPSAGTIKNLYVRMWFNNDTAAETVTSRINGSTGNLTVSVPSATTGTFEDSSNSDSISANDLFAWSVSQNGTGSLWFTNIIVVNFETTDGNFVVAGGTAAGQSIADGVTKFLTNYEVTDTEVDQHYRIFNSYTLSKLWIRIKTNATTSTSSFQLRKNEASTALSVSITAGTTGVFVDDSNSVAVSSGDELTMRLVNGGGGSLTFTAWSMRVEAAGSQITTRSLTDTIDILDPRCSDDQAF